MQWFLWCLILFTVKADMKDTYFCFFKRGKCRHVCNSVEKKVGFCTKLNGNCCIWVPEMKAIIFEDQSTVRIKISNKQNGVTNPSYTVHVVPFVKWCSWRIFSFPKIYQSWETSKVQGRFMETFDHFRYHVFPKWLKDECQKKVWFSRFFNPKIVKKNENLSLCEGGIKTDWRKGTSTHLSTLWNKDQIHFKQGG